MKVQNWSKQAMICLIVFIMVFGSIPSWVSPDGSQVQAAGGFNGGNGSEIDPFLISTVDQLSEVRDYPSSYFELINDIDLSDYIVGSPWEPIGTYTDPFTGSLNGNDHIISNLYVDYTVSNDYKGLFGYVEGSGSIKNLELENVNVSGDYHVGALVGYVHDGIFENIKVTGKVFSWDDYVGGVIGYSVNTKLTNVNAKVDVTGDYDYVGGITGYSTNGSVSDVYFEGNVEGSHYYIGGLFGHFIDGTIRNSGSKGSVSGHQYIGGLVGAIENSKVSESYSHSDVSNTDDDMGGLIGNSMKSHIEYSYATGNVTGEDDLGGLVGYSEETKIEYSYATGNVIGGDDVGGLVGDNEGGTISHSFATGNVTATSYVGGLVGENESPDVGNKSTIEYSYATGNVNGEPLKDEPKAFGLGGLVGYNKAGVVSNSYATGAVTGDTIVGGLVGDNEEGSVENSYSIGLVTGDSFAGGLVGSNINGIIEGSYYDTETSGQSDNLGEGLASQAMKIIVSYVDWDFDSIWHLDVHNNGYPYFKTHQFTYVSNDANLDGELTNINAYILNSPVLVIGNEENWGMPGFLFKHWNTERDGTGISYSEGDTISSHTSIILYAIWIENNENLSGLSLSEGINLSPDFSENETSYTARVANSVSSIKVIPDLFSSDSTVTVAINDETANTVRSGQESLELTLGVGKNTINVVVTAVDGTTTKTYTVIVTRGNPQNVVTPSYSSNANLKQLSLDGEVQLDTEFSSDVLSYSLNVDHSLHQVSITPTLADNNATVELQLNGVTYVVASGSKSSELPLKVGSNVIEIIITAENGTIKRYTLTIARNQEIEEADYKCLFNDIENHWARAEICEAAGLGITKGKDTYTFAPDTAITRTEFVVMLLHTLQIVDVAEPIDMPYDDQESIPEWARPAIETAIKQGIIEGYPDGTLRPLATISRIEMAAIIVRVTNWQNDSNISTSFSDDTSIPNWAKGYVQIVRDQGILTGRTHNTFVPFGITTRAEAAVTLLRLWNIQ
ncbi:MAG TPA: S-layer homology domain-containing protein [Candidatus Paenibacillus intestinavium]|nr:S-layer homology domain-containing protein [Candidatus Paenibacillus intestinavium]